MTLRVVPGAGPRARLSRYGRRGGLRLIGAGCFALRLAGVGGLVHGGLPVVPAIEVVVLVLGWLLGRVRVLETVSFLVRGRGLGLGQTMLFPEFISNIHLLLASGRVLGARCSVEGRPVLGCFALALGGCIRSGPSSIGGEGVVTDSGLADVFNKGQESVLEVGGHLFSGADESFTLDIGQTGQIVAVGIGRVGDLVGDVWRGIGTR